MQSYFFFEDECKKKNTLGSRFNYIQDESTLRERFVPVLSPTAVTLTVAQFLFLFVMIIEMDLFSILN